MLLTVVLLPAGQIQHFAKYFFQRFLTCNITTYELMQKLRNGVEFLYRLLRFKKLLWMLSLGGRLGVFWG
jgi:hypothetical protein